MSWSMEDDIYWPADSDAVTEEAGTRGGQHYGMDFGLPEGTPLIAPFDGKVVWTGNDGASGYYAPAKVWANGPALIMDIQRADGLVSRFAHLSGFAANVGDSVRAGDLIAYSGNSGFSTGPHLHWELRWDRRLGSGRWINPRDLRPQHFTSATQRKEIPMPALIRNYDTSIGFVNDAGELDAISSLTEVEALKATGIVGDWVQMPDGLIWNTLAARTARLRAQQSGVDEKQLASGIAALIVSPVVEALANAGSLTRKDVEQAVSKVMSDILAKAAA